MSFSHKFPDGSCSHQAIRTDLQTDEAVCADCGEVIRAARVRVENVPCTVTVFNEANTPWATRNAGPHDWRLLSRETRNEHEYEPQPGAPGWGNVVIIPIGWTETWYCTRCRLVDERFVPRPS